MRHCPTPAKKRYRSIDTAVRVAAGLTTLKGSPPHWPYFCPCGEYHLTTTRPR